MSGIYKKLWLFAIAAAALFGMSYISNSVNAEMRYISCSANEPGSGDFQSSVNCGLLSKLNWCDINSSSINVSVWECEALAYLYEETKGNLWTNNTNWFTNTDMGTREGFSGSLAMVVTGWHVTHLDLHSNNLDGTVVTGLQNLSYLVQLELQFNNIEGAVDTSNNTDLQRLYLYENPSITSVILPTTNTLTELWLSDTSIATLDLSPTPNIGVLDLSNTLITGFDFSGLNSLGWIDLSHNALTSVQWSMSSSIFYLDISYQSWRAFTDLDISTITNAYTINASHIGLKNITMAPRIPGTGLLDTFWYDNATNFDFSYNTLCDLPYGDTLLFLENYNVSRDQSQYCPIHYTNSNVGNEAVMFNRTLPSDYGLLGQLSWYTIGAAFLSGVETVSAYAANSYTFRGSPLSNGHAYTFTICAVYNDGVSICTDETATPDIATPYALIEVTPVAPVITSLSARYSFYVSGTVGSVGETIVSDCGWGSNITAEALRVNSGMTLEISNLQRWKTYECDVSVRSLPWLEESNILHIGPFTVASASAGWGGGSANIDYCPNGDTSSSYYDDACGDLVTSWQDFFALHSDGVSKVGSPITVKAFVTDVFALLHITKPIHRQADSDTKVVPDKLVIKVMQVLQTLLDK